MKQSELDKLSSSNAYLDWTKSGLRMLFLYTSPPSRFFTLLPRLNWNRNKLDRNWVVQTHLYTEDWTESGLCMMWLHTSSPSIWFFTLVLNHDDTGHVIPWQYRTHTPPPGSLKSELPRPERLRPTHPLTAPRLHHREPPHPPRAASTESPHIHLAPPGGPTSGADLLRTTLSRWAETPKRWRIGGQIERRRRRGWSPLGQTQASSHRKGCLLACKRRGTWRQ
jgi:hypothetical protein